MPDTESASYKIVDRMGTLPLLTEMARLGDTLTSPIQPYVKNSLGFVVLNADDIACSGFDLLVDTVPSVQKYGVTDIYKLGKDTAFDYWKNSINIRPSTASIPKDLTDLTENLKPSLGLINMTNMASEYWNKVQTGVEKFNNVSMKNTDSKDDEELITPATPTMTTKEATKPTTAPKPNISPKPKDLEKPSQ